MQSLSRGGSRPADPAPPARRSPAQQARDAGRVATGACTRSGTASTCRPPLPPLIDHADVVKRLESLTDGAPDLFKVEKIGESIEGRSINHVARRLRSAARAALVADARRRAHRDVGALRSVRVPAAASRRSAGPPPPGPTDAARRADAQSRRRRALPAAQRAEHRRQSRRASAADARGPGAEGLRDRLNPSVGFNLHNQSWRTSVGDPPKPASISLLSVAYDEAANRERRAAS